MRIFLDESLPRGLKRLLEGLDVLTVPELEWQGVLNRELLTQASREFDVFVTADQNLEYRQNVAALTIAIVVLVAASNRLDAYQPIASKIRKAIERARPGAVAKVAVTSP